MANWKKDPDDTEDFWFDWGSDDIEDPTKRFLPESENITAATVSILDEGVDQEDSDFTDKVVRIRTSGGSLGIKVRVECVITTNMGQIFSMTKVLEIKERIST